MLVDILGTEAVSSPQILIFRNTCTQCLSHTAKQTVAQAVLAGLAALVVRGKDTINPMPVVHQGLVVPQAVLMPVLVVPVEQAAAEELMVLLVEQAQLETQVLMVMLAAALAALVAHQVVQQAQP